MACSLEGRTLFQLKEIDSMNREAQVSLQELRGRGRGLYSLQQELSRPQVPNEELYDTEWKRTIEDLPIYFNADGTRTKNASNSRSVSKSRSATPLSVTPRQHSSL